jgi:hypothetical protein
MTRQFEWSAGFQLGAWGKFEPTVMDHFNCARVIKNVAV